MASQQQLLEFYLNEKKERKKAIKSGFLRHQKASDTETGSKRNRTENAKPTTLRVKENETRPSSAFFLSKPQKFQLKTSEVAFYRFPEWLVDMSSVKTQGTALS